MVGITLQLAHRYVRSLMWCAILLKAYPVVTFGNLCGSLFFASVLVKCEFAFRGIFMERWLTDGLDTGIISTAPYNAYAVTFAL